ncbi:MAG TPA: hypothetical protein V6D27_04600 [Vampirovibrionales bacterium]
MSQIHNTQHYLNSDSYLISPVAIASSFINDSRILPVAIAPKKCGRLRTPTAITVETDTYFFLRQSQGAISPRFQGATLYSSADFSEASKAARFGPLFQNCL